jgi:hypothetical protein
VWRRHLRYNRISALGGELSGLKHLKTLRLDSNLLVSPIGGLPTEGLMELDISGNTLTSLAGVDKVPVLANRHLPPWLLSSYRIYVGGFTSTALLALISQVLPVNNSVKQ